MWERHMDIRPDILHELWKLQGSRAAFYCLCALMLGVLKKSARMGSPGIASGTCTVYEQMNHSDSGIDKLYH